MRSQERIKLERGIDELMRARKVASMTNSVNQQNPKMNNNKSKDSQQEAQPGKKSTETQESVNISPS
jgi:hypothetical protein